MSPIFFDGWSKSQAKRGAKFLGLEWGKVWERGIVLLGVYNAKHQRTTISTNTQCLV